MTVTIRFYKDEDYETLREILQEAGLFDEVWEARENLKRKISRDPESILLAEGSEKVVGCAFIVEDGWNAFIWRLAVKKEHRKQGVGQKIMQEADRIIKSRGIKESSIFVDSKNEELKGWYKKQDYILTSDFTFMYKKL